MTAPAASFTPAANGTFRVTARKGNQLADLSWFRGIPTSIDNYSFADPFGPVQAQITMPAVTFFDRLGYGELWWATKDVDIDILFTGALPPGYPYTVWKFEGYIDSPERSNNGLALTIKGAMYQVDNHLAKPEYPLQPLPYEVAIAKQFSEDASLRLSPLVMTFPADWDVIYSPVKTDPLYLTPSGVTPTTPWTGLVTRATGSWDAALTSYVQGLLSTMWTKHGRWTLDLLPGRAPVLFHRLFADDPDAATVSIDLLAPGVAPSLNEDWSQSANAIYGNGVALTGESYSGQQVSVDGQQTTYVPFAALRQVDPPTSDNAWFDPSVVRREILLQFQQGLDDAQARSVANEHLAMVAAPGVTGTIELTTDVVFGGVPMSRFLLRPGMVVQCPGYNGIAEGVLLHISQVEADTAQATVTLTVDSLYRDALTLAEVGLRGRDALNVQRSLIGGQFQPPVPDQLMPWSYAEGSGFIPSGPHYSSQPLFDDIDNDLTFPYAEITQARPPRLKAWAHSYIHIPPADLSNANNNWAVYPARYAQAFTAYPLRLAQAGTIRLLELAAYDRDGQVMDVPFHFSLYYTNSVNIGSMPTLSGPRAPDPSTGDPGDPEGVVHRYNRLHGTKYAAGQSMPYFDGAWEQYAANGTEIQTANAPGSPVAVSSAQLIRGWGTGIVRAGFWPGSDALKDKPSGLLRDETQFPFDCTTGAALTGVNPYQVNQTQQFPGYVYLMLYCDAQGDQDVFFMGRMYNLTPGSAT